MTIALRNSYSKVFLKMAFLKIGNFLEKVYSSLIVRNGATWGRLEPMTKIQKSKIQKILSFEFLF